MLDLFKNYINTIAVCHVRGLGIIASNYAHVDQQEGIDYVNGVRKNLSYPLSCLSSYIDIDAKVIKSAYDKIIQGY